MRMFQSSCSTHRSCPKGRRSPQRLKARQSSRRKGYVSRNMRWHARTHLVCYIREECCERRKREKKRRKELVLCACVCVCVCSVRACGRVCGERSMDGVRRRQHFHVIAVAHGCCLDLPFPPFHPFPSLWTDSPNTLRLMSLSTRVPVTLPTLLSDPQPSFYHLSLQSNSLLVNYIHCCCLCRHKTTPPLVPPWRVCVAGTVTPPILLVFATEKSKSAQSSPSRPPRGGSRRTYAGTPSAGQWHAKDHLNPEGVRWCYCCCCCCCCCPSLPLPCSFLAAAFLHPPLLPWTRMVVHVRALPHLFPSHRQTHLFPSHRQTQPKPFPLSCRNLAGLSFRHSSKRKPRKRCWRGRLRLRRKGSILSARKHGKR